MAVAVRTLTPGKEALRDDEVQAVLCPGHGHVKQTPLLFGLSRRAGAQIGGDAAINGVEHEHGFPFLSLGGMDCGENEIVFVQERHACLAAGGVRGIERQVCQEALA